MVDREHYNPKLKRFRPGYHWEHIPATWDRRVTESGVTFEGHWAKDEPKNFKNCKKDKECQ